MRRRLLMAAGIAGSFIVASGSFWPAAANNVTVTAHGGDVTARYIDLYDRICVNNGSGITQDADVVLYRPNGSVFTTVTDGNPSAGSEACSPNLSIPEDQYGWKISLVFTTIKFSDPFYT